MKSKELSTIYRAIENATLCVTYTATHNATWEAASQVSLGELYIAIRGSTYEASYNATWNATRDFLNEL